MLLLTPALCAGPMMASTGFCYVVNALWQCLHSAAGRQSQADLAVHSCSTEGKGCTMKMQGVESGLLHQRQSCALWRVATLSGLQTTFVRHPLSADQGSCARKAWND